MTISTRLSEKDFISASLAFLSKTRFKIFALLIIGICTYNLLFSKRKHTGSGGIITTVLPVIIMLTVFGLLFYFNLKRTYRKTPRAGEPKTFTFNQEQMLMDGETFSFRLDWSKVPKVTKTKNWLLIYENSNMAHPIPRRDISDQQMAQLKEMLEYNRVKNNL